MKTHFPTPLGGLGLASPRIGTDADSKRTPKVIIGAVGEPLATDLAAHFAKLGWRVKRVTDGDDARRHATHCRAHAVVLPVESFAESGFLACAKLAMSLPKARVVLVGEDSDDNERFALFAGAAGYATPDTPAGELVGMILGRLAPLVN
jgi:DNA-binding response OmpR family regulator